MTIEEFQRLHNFSIEEVDIYGRPIIAQISKIQSNLMQKIDEAVLLAKQNYGKRGSFIVHCITLGEHAESSQHYQGKAIDGHFRGLNLYQSVMLLFKMGFTGIGFYPDWKHPGVHADIREQNHVSTWYARNEGGKQKYYYNFNDFIEFLLIEAEIPRGYVDKSLEFLNGSD